MAALPLETAPWLDKSSLPGRRGNSMAAAVEVPARDVPQWQDLEKDLKMPDRFENQLWVEPVGNLVIARLRGSLTAELLEECSNASSFLSGRPASLVRFTTRSRWKRLRSRLSSPSGTSRIGRKPGHFDARSWCQIPRLHTLRGWRSVRATVVSSTATWPRPSVGWARAAKWARRWPRRVSPGSPRRARDSCRGRCSRGAPPSARGSPHRPSRAETPYRRRNPSACC